MGGREEVRGIGGVADRNVARGGELEKVGAPTAVVLNGGGYSQARTVDIRNHLVQGHLLRERGRARDCRGADRGFEVGCAQEVRSVCGIADSDIALRRGERDDIGTAVGIVRDGRGDADAAAVDVRDHVVKRVGGNVNGERLGAATHRCQRERAVRHVGAEVRGVEQRAIGNGGFANREGGRATSGCTDGVGAVRRRRAEVAFAQGGRSIDPGGYRGAIDGGRSRELRNIDRVRAQR